MNQHRVIKAVRVVFRHALPIVIIVVAVLIAKRLVAGRPETKRRTTGEQTVAVRTVSPVLTNHTVVIEAMGHVLSAMKVDIRAQVGGEVVRRHPALEAGGRISKGDRLIEIDTADYEAALTEAQSLLAQARLNESLERQRQIIAKDEWERSGKQAIDPLSMAITIREPYLEAAQKATLAAEAAVGRAKRNLERTRIRAPFDAMVLSASVEMGSVVAPQSMLASLSAVDRLYVEAAIPLSSIDWLGALENGQFISPPDVDIAIMSSHQNIVQCRGKVIRLLGDISDSGLMARVLIEINDPDRVADGKLLIGAYVKCLIHGRRLDRVVRLPRMVLRDNDTLWAVDQASRLDVIAPPTRWKEAHVVLYDADVLPTNRVIISTALPAAIPGMKIEVVQQRAGDDDKL